MKRPKFESIFENESEYCEVCVSEPIPEMIPNQAITLKELVSRFERGQRLNVHSNFAAGSNFQNITDAQSRQQIEYESMDTDDFPPTGVFDVADVEAHYREHQVHKTEFQQRMKKKREEAKQAKPKQAPQADEHIPPASPAE